MDTGLAGYLGARVVPPVATARGREAEHALTLPLQKVANLVREVVRILVLATYVAVQVISKRGIIYEFRNKKECRAFWSRSCFKSDYPNTYTS